MFPFLAANVILRNVYSLCDGVRCIGAERVVDKHVVGGARVLNVEEWEREQDGLAFGSADLPLAARLGWIIVWVTRRIEHLDDGSSLQIGQTLPFWRERNPL